MNKSNLSNITVLFGGTGDLAKRKIFPALYHLQKGGDLPQGFALVAVGRRQKNHQQYREYIYSFMEKEADFTIDKEAWEALSQRIYYLPFHFDDPAGYERLKEFLAVLENIYQTQGNRIYYLAVAPEYFGLIVQQPKVHDMDRKENSWRRVVIEKPFGKDLNSARKLNQIITEVFEEKNIYRIDHYLGKEMLQNIMVIRFTNAFFEPIWNSQYIDNIQISSSEQLGVGTRGEYYDQSGALRDMIQNHMMQLLTLTAMEPPIRLDNQSIRDEKIRVLRSLEELSQKTVFENIVRGQYSAGRIDGKPVKGYREEEGVNPASTTETFVAMKMAVENYRWVGVPFYIRTGKRMPVKSTEIVVEFKRPPEVLYFKEYKNLQPNLLVIGIQPKEGAFLRFNAKKPGTIKEIIPVEMDYCQNCQVEQNSPEAYERLIYDVMRGESTLFTRWDEVEYSWKIVDNIERAWRRKAEEILLYPAGERGPQGAMELLQRDNRKWWNILGG
jgi:glucose-6-phosphate 1-dehydrogenase